jgi:hypothetical protein
VGADSAGVGSAYGVVAALPPRPQPAAVPAPTLDAAAAGALAAAGFTLAPGDPALGRGVTLLSHPPSSFRMLLAPGPARGYPAHEVAVVPQGGGGLGPFIPAWLGEEVSLDVGQVAGVAAKLVEAVAAFDAAHKVA